MTLDPASWRSYIETFHRDQPGITEDLLRRTRDRDGRDPYRWLAEGHPSRALVVDLGCGSGPMRDALSECAGWIGVDPSPGELERAMAQGRSPVVMARAEALPIRDHAVAGIVAAMSLMVVEELELALAEAARVLRPGGRLHALLPARSPLTVGDRVRYGLLLGILGTTAMPFPQTDHHHRVPDALLTAGFEIVDRESARFAYPLEAEADAERFIASLYLPATSGSRVRRAGSVARAGAHGSLGIPLERIVAIRR